VNRDGVIKLKQLVEGWREVALLLSECLVMLDDNNNGEAEFNNPLYEKGRDLADRLLQQRKLGRLSDVGEVIQHPISFNLPKS